MLRWVAAGLWGLSAAALAGLTLHGDANPVFVGACLLMALLIAVGGDLGLVGAVLGAILAGFWTVFTFAFTGYGEGAPDDNGLYVVIGAALTIVSGLAARDTKLWMSRRSFKSAPELEAAHASGTVSDAMHPFEVARLELVQTGKRRIFVCGRCGKGLSLAWKKCEHCKATFDEFPPIDSGLVA